METSGHPTREGPAPGGPPDGAALRPSLPPVLLVVAVCVVVAITTNGLRLIGPAADPSPTWLWAIRFAGAAAIGGGLAALLGQRRALRAEGGRSDPTVVAVRTAAAIMGVLTVVALLVHPVGGTRARAGAGASTSLARSAGSGDSGEGRPAASSGSMAGNAVMGGGAGEGGNGGGGGPMGPQGGGFDRTPLQRMARSLLPVLLLLVAAMAFRALSRGPRPGEMELRLGMPLDAADAEAGLAASLLEIESDSPDPRRQITAAYHRLLAALAAAGAPRRPQEAPHEHLHRALGPLGVRPGPLHRLTELYVLAQFSERPITERHRAAAAEALDASLAGLRATHSSLRPGEARPAHAEAGA